MREGERERVRGVGGYCASVTSLKDWISCHKISTSGLFWFRFYITSSQLYVIGGEEN